MQAASSFGIAFIFDPIDPEQKWDERPVWQKTVFFVQLGFVAAMFGLVLGLSDYKL